MKRREFFQRAAGSALAFGLTDLLESTFVLGEENSAEYRVVGKAFDGCACHVPCPCAFAGSFKEGCNNIAVIALSSGMYKTADLSGAKVAQAGLAGSWVHIYIDASDPQREAATAFAKAVFAPYGKVEAIKNTKIDVSGNSGGYKLSIDAGKVAEMITEPMLGADGKTPITLTNVAALFGPTVTQAKTVKCVFHDGDRSFRFEDSNCMFKDPLDTSGKFELA